MKLDDLPSEVLEHLPGGYEPEDGVWLVLPWDNDTENCIVSANVWIRAEPPYPEQFEAVVWFGADGVGNHLGWDQEKLEAILWNPYENEPMWSGSVSDLWEFILGGYGCAA